MIIELHALQYFPVNNLNRDDTGAPKTTTLGGGTRARWSTQSQKRLMRESMINVAPEHCGMRTRWLPEMIADELANTHGHSRDEALAAAAFMLRALGFSTESGPYGRGPDARPAVRTNVLIFCRTDTPKLYARFLDERWGEARSAATSLPTAPRKSRAKAAAPADDGEAADPEENTKKAARAAFEKTFGTDCFITQRKVLSGEKLIDIALFGRMLAELPDGKIDGAVSVAHAITTHVITLDFDYYTAVDDAQRDDTSGASMIGVQPYTSGVYYRYLSLDVETLTERLDGDIDLIRLAATSLSSAFVHLRPRARATNSAPFTRPGLLLAVAATAPHSLAAAFVRPVTGEHHGLLAASADTLARHWNSRIQGFSGPAGQPPFRTARYSVLNPDIADLPGFALDAATRETRADDTIATTLETALA